MKRFILPLVISPLLAFFYSLAYTVAGPMVLSQEFGPGAGRVIPFIVCFSVCTGLNILFFLVIPGVLSHIGKKAFPLLPDRLSDNALLLILWGFILIFWIPAFLIFFPGILSYDMISQTGSALGEITNNHHPVLHTFLLRVFMRFGEALFSSCGIGLGFLSAFQMILLSYALARLAVLLKRFKVPGIVIIITAVFSGLWFMNACLSVTMIKDTLHSAFLVLFLCHFTEIVKDPGAYCKSRANYFLFPIVSFLMFATRNNGLHIYLFALILLLLFRIKKIKAAKPYIPLFIVMLLPVLLFKIYTGPVFYALGIEQGQIREALSIPIQQMQRVAVKMGNALSPEQTEKLDYYIDNLRWMDPPRERAYDPYISDPAKSCFYSDRYNEDPVAFWRFYFSLGRQFSKEYLMAFLSNTAGYWYPGYYGYSYVMYDNYPPESFALPLERMSLINAPALERLYYDLCTSETLRKTPVLRVFFVPGFSLWILLFSFMLFIVRAAGKEKGFFTENLPLFFPLFAQFGIMLLSPMASFRYSWPLFLMLPVLFIVLFGGKDNAEKNG